jgi:hypothetical protein
MNLHEQLNRIQEMMGVIKESKKLEFLKDELDKLFNKLTIERIFPDLLAYKWLDKDGNQVFEKNHWGMLFINNSNFIERLKSFAINLLTLTEKEYKNELINYLNTKYKEEFENKPIRDIDKFNRLFDNHDAW